MRLFSFDLRWFGTLVGLIALFLVFYNYKGVFMNWLISFFSIKDIGLFLGAIASITSIVHKLKYKKIVFNPTMTFGQFKEPLETLTSFISSPIALVCSFSILKNLFLQYANKQISFTNFDTLEISFLWIVAGYLMFNSSSVLILDLKEVFSKIQPTENPEPLSENEYLNTQN